VSDESPEQRAVNDAIDRWHEGDSALPLHEYLGMTRDEWERFVKNSSELPKSWKEVTT